MNKSEQEAPKGASVDSVHDREKARVQETLNKGITANMHDDPAALAGQNPLGAAALNAINRHSDDKKKKERDRFYSLIRRMQANSPAEQQVIDRIEKITNVADQLRELSKKLGDYDDIAGQAGRIQDLQDKIADNGGMLDAGMKAEARLQIEKARKKLGLSKLDTDDMTDIQIMAELTKAKVALNERAEVIQEIDQAEDMLMRHAAELRDKLEAIQNDEDLSQEQRDAMCKALLEDSDQQVLEILDSISDHPEVKNVIGDFNAVSFTDDHIPEAANLVDAEYSELDSDAFPVEPFEAPSF